MKLIIVSGLSGSGKTVALRTLEDAGYYCIDNLPVALLSTTVERLLQHDNSLHQDIAIGIDIRTGENELATLPEVCSSLNSDRLACRILFLQADNGSLLRRYNETRRRHPLAAENKPLPAAIESEREILAPVCSSADFIVDTSNLNLHELRRKILAEVAELAHSLQIEIKSFGFKYGTAEDADMLFDMRCLPNPHWQSELRPLTGKDFAVEEFLRQEPQTEKIMTQLTNLIGDWVPFYKREGRAYLTIAIGCTGGQHRSVFIAEQLYQQLTDKLNDQVTIRHRELT
ncbi:RNase adapter RapZ [Solemya velum gill symbiont]|uniref:RNase adaptor protein RapZ n=3 Tax=Solemya velum gill symbiont TaxID=2340 RepID=A0A1T2DLN2_SOVGS|nr:RNase adapter RapZ [Solemya velum gill symbiont]OOY36204.1 RNase adaptor protein RapZ [Solemya velum gill symbiont]OOY44559.1 RNase adaptor protein RapZ [Solemya velum gill symbiont]OOY46804.1 RNase adaptor protein RapZ [Solemya velum gill symbiont]OOY47972.1 RNase adaptor protein RapZ [Solemya velum gill symbiont]OOY49464.1 RNase adaptor protein RapZ [Solemya velum gill symbiont]